MGKFYVWVIECYIDGGWVPQSCCFTREEAREKQIIWKADNPKYRFRIKKYFSEDY